MGLIKKKKSNLSSDYLKQEEDRQLNHWSYNDDPMLNLEPVFIDSENAGPSLKDVTRELNLESDSQNQETEEIAEKLASMKKKLNILKPNKKNSGPLGSIINNARNNSEKLQNQIIENDPVIAKLHKIEQLKRSGGVDENLYTDLSKSKIENYADRAKQFLNKNLKNKKIESELERKMRLSKEAQEKREARDGALYTGVFDFKQTNNKKNYKKVEELKKEIIEKISFLKELNDIDFEKETNVSLEEIENKEYSSGDAKKKFLTSKLKNIDEYLSKIAEKIKKKI
ncbi:hypothetical protein SGLAD_v1c08780 [Spiroplasma gladiatoris]|uniref:Uncharacterized protein n=1 Tax=Spiroplasma gladiatoris TaxID=2143 RepID=A0A4P7AIG8_9MOLU|nr:hypothetical protein [Spiroplasma gladiatoris]QBQ08077.1 hypothetical protein SGLAD_v1c08780 [Spiroplasma gladiatoris]